MKTFILGFLFWSAVYGSELHLDFNPVVELGKTEAWTAQRLFSDGKVRIRFRFSAGKDSVYSPPIASTLLVSAKTVVWNGKTYLLTSWQEGVSTTALRVFDPLSKEKLILLERYSIGEVKVKITTQGLQLTVAERGDWPLEPKYTTTEWSAP